MIQNVIDDMVHPILPLHVMQNFPALCQICFNFWLVVCFAKNVGSSKKRIVQSERMENTSYHNVQTTHIHPLIIYIYIILVLDFITAFSSQVVWLPRCSTISSKRSACSARRAMKTHSSRVPDMAPAADRNWSQVTSMAFNSVTSLGLHGFFG